jgi:hypothetical protein
MEITYADTSPPCPSCAALRSRVAVLEKVAEEADDICQHLGENAELEECCVPRFNRIRAALDALKEGK